MKTVIQQKVFLNINEVSHNVSDPKVCQYEFTAVGMEEPALIRSIQALFGLSGESADGKGLDGLEIWTREVQGCYLRLSGGLQVSH